MPRMMIAFLVAPLWVPFLFGIWQPSKFFGEWVVIVGLIFGYVPAFLFGLPAHLLLRAKRSSLLAYLLTWLGIGLVYWFLAPAGLGFIVGNSFLLTLWDLAETFLSRPHVPLMAGILSTLVGATVWMITRPAPIRR